MARKAKSVRPRPKAKAKLRSAKGGWKLKATAGYDIAQEGTVQISSLGARDRFIEYDHYGPSPACACGSTAGRGSAASERLIAAQP